MCGWVCVCVCSCIFQYNQSIISVLSQDSSDNDIGLCNVMVATFCLIL